MASQPQQTARATTIFNRLVYGRRAGDPLVNVDAISANDNDYQPEQDGSAPRMYTPREVNQARGIGFAMREAHRRASWYDRQLTTEAEALDAPAYEWKPARPTRARR